MFIDELGRKCEIVNLDFANDTLPYTAAIDVRELVSLQVQYKLNSMMFVVLYNRFRTF